MSDPNYDQWVLDFEAAMQTVQAAPTIISAAYEEFPFDRTLFAAWSKMREAEAHFDIYDALKESNPASALEQYRLWMALLLDAGDLFVGYIKGKEV